MSVLNATRTPARCRTERMRGPQGRPTGVNAHVSVISSCVPADLSSSMCVHRAIFTYDGFTNKLKLADSGGKNDRSGSRSSCSAYVDAQSPSLAAGGVEELAAKFHVSKPQYGLCKVTNTETGAPQIALISWVSRMEDGGTWSRVGPEQMMRWERRRST